MDNLSVQPNINKKSSNKLLIICLISFFTILGFSAGYFFNYWENDHQTVQNSVQKEIIDKATEKNVSADINFNLFWQVWDTVKKKYVNPSVDENKMFYGALTGIVASLQDPYSVFLNPELTKSFNDEINGTFEGIGAEIDIKDNKIVIVAPLPGTPAAQQDLRPGDIILAIDQIDTSNISLDNAIKLIRGPKGTSVKLLVQRGNEEPKEFNINRDVIKVDSVKWEIKEKNNIKVGYITITNFNEDTTNKFDEAINDILLQQPQGIILDLRNNPGGLLNQSIAVASRFIPEGVIVYEEYRDGTKHEYRSLENARLAGIKTVILINEGSASASEIVAGAMKDYQVATLVGKKTFGKGSVQDLEQFTDGSSLKLTVAHWLTPKGTSINEKGIDPDEEIDLTEDDIKQDNDPQLNRALDIIINK